MYDNGDMSFSAVTEAVSIHIDMGLGDVAYDSYHNLREEASAPWPRNNYKA